MLWISQYSLHCPSTFVLPRRVKRCSRLLWCRLPKTGSTVAQRRIILSLPLRLSSLRFLRAVYGSGLPAVGPSKMATCHTGVWSGDRRQHARTGQRRRARQDSRVSRCGLPAAAQPCSFWIHPKPQAGGGHVHEVVKQHWRPTVHHFPCLIFRCKYHDIYSPYLSCNSFLRQSWPVITLRH